ncbi:hypothetical protein L596_027467 [Steinernema carpocapsae]|uniref:Uncharacterized protein n=1 Tax=Steinernema carpocapsae TaxID=34508 RepID=A0A4U5LVJ8_STECR|nr:hypothetical protein L596_027467 [Steinernema carpocapsae]
MSLGTHGRSSRDERALPERPEARAKSLLHQDPSQEYAGRVLQFRRDQRGDRVGSERTRRKVHRHRKSLLLLLRRPWKPVHQSLLGPKDEEMEIPRFHDRELLASKHVDVVPVESIEGHAYVLTLPEYNRFVADCMLDDLPTYLKQKREAVCPLSTDDYPSERLLPSELTPDSPAVFLSRYAWSFQHHKILRGEQFKKYQPWGRSNNSSKLKSSSPKRT